MNNKVLLIGLLIVSNLLLGQNYKFGKVSVQDFEEKKEDIQNLGAKIIYRDVKVNYDLIKEKGFYKVTKFYERIKIFNKEGYKWANKLIRLYDESASNKEKLQYIKGYTYSIEGGQLKKNKLKKENIFEEKINQYWRKKSFTFPNVKDGCVIEYEYEIRSPFIQIDDVVFQEVIPVEKMDISIRIPEYFSFKEYLNPKAQYIPKLRKEAIERTEKLMYKERYDAGLVTKTKYNERELQFKENIIKAELINIPHLEEEFLVDNIDNYKAKLKLEYVASKDLNGKMDYYSVTWDDVVKSIYSSESFGGQIKKQSYFKKDLDLILSNSKSKQELVGMIYSLVKQRVKWNGFLGYFVNNGVKTAYKEGEGNVAEINLMLTSMLRYAGINANPILISTKSNGIPLYPTRKGFNYVISGIELENSVLLLDATQSHNTINNLHPDVLNWQGRIIREHGSSAWVNLYPKKHSVNTTIVFSELDEDMSIVGKVRDQKTDYFAYKYRSDFLGVQGESLKNYLAKKSSDIEIGKIKVVNDENLGKPVIVSYDFAYEGGVEEIGNEILVSPLMYLSEEENVFNAEKRNYPIDFNFPFIDKKIINLTIPSGYKIKSYPKSEKAVMVGNMGEYSYLVKVDGNKIQILQTLKINFPIVPANYYEGLRDTYKKLIDKNAEKIVLEKI